MAWDDPYMTVEDFKARVGSVGTATDASLLAVLTSASRQIDAHCGQSFNQTAAGTIKYMTSMFPDVIETQPLVSIAELATDEGSRTYPTVWSATDYDLFPYDASARNEPYTEIRRSPLGVYSWPSDVRGVRITGIWGWPAVPNQVKEATFLVANRLKSLWNAPFGATGGGAMGNLKMMSTDLDPFVAQMLYPFRVIAI